MGELGSSFRGYSGSPVDCPQGGIIMNTDDYEDFKSKIKQFELLDYKRETLERMISMLDDKDLDIEMNLNGIDLPRSTERSPKASFTFEPESARFYDAIRFNLSSQMKNVLALVRFAIADL
jgi:hypothetical protein